MQNAGIAALGLHWRYVAFDVHPDDLAAAIGGAMAMKFIGLNLTVPHKLLALPMVDLLDESATLWGAVNTIRFEARDDQETGNRCVRLADQSRMNSAPMDSTPTLTPLSKRCERISD